MRANWKAESSWALFTFLAASAGAAWAEDEAEPVELEPLDMEFLEYLGSWESSDDEWLLFAGDDVPQDPTTDAPARPVESAEMDAETDDE